MKLFWIAIASAALPVAGASAQSAKGIAGDLVISEVYEANGGTVKYVELHNTSGAAINLATVDAALLRYSNTDVTSSATINLSGTISAGDFFVVGDPSVDTIFGAMTVDQQTTAINHNGNDKYELVINVSTTPVVIDAFAADNIADGTNFATNVVAFRVGSQLPNDGDWGSTTQPADGNSSTSGFWIVRDITASNANATMVATPGTPGGAGGTEVPVELMDFDID